MQPPTDPVSGLPFASETDLRVVLTATRTPPPSPEEITQGLRNLVAAGLLKTTRVGLTTYYAVTPEGERWITALCEGENL